MEPERSRTMVERCPLLAAASAIILAIQPSKVRGTADVCSGKRCAWYDENRKCCGIVSGKEQPMESKELIQELRSDAEWTPKKEEK